MPYQVTVLRAADKYLDKLHKQQPGDAEALENALEDLAHDPRPSGSKPLKGYTGVWRHRVGSYRICYEINDGKLVVLVITISTRDDVYAVLRRHLGR